MHLEYCEEGPNEVGRSRSYRAFEVQVGEHGVFLAGHIREGDEETLGDFGWPEVAVIWNNGRIDSLEPGREEAARGAITLWIEPDKEDE